MLRFLLPLLTAILLFPAVAAQADDRADEYPGITRVTDNYEVRDRRQNYDETKFPISIDKKHSAEGERTVIEYSYRRHDVNASRLQFQRHFERITRSLGGEVVFAGKSEGADFVVTFRYPKAGKTVWVAAEAHGSKENLSWYKLNILETTQAWDGAAPAAEAAPVTKRPPAPKFVPPAEPQADKPVRGAWNGGSWQPVDFDGCDGHTRSQHKNAEPLNEFCDESMAGLVAVCFRTGCDYKDLGPKQCRGGSKPGRMFVCMPN